MENSIGILENFMKQSTTIKSMFRSKKSSIDGASPTSTTHLSPKSISQLSPFANSVIARCSMILDRQTEELQCSFESEMLESVKQPEVYARNLLEYGSYQALQVVNQRSDFLSDKEIRRLTYDMMIAWESPGVESETVTKVDGKKTVGPEAFARIAPACVCVADIITVHNLFDALTSSSGGQLHYLIYDKYLGSLDKVIKVAKSALGLPLTSNLQLTEAEIILDVDGTIPTQPVLQHIGISAWPGRLTLTNYAIYFESLGVGLYEKALRYDLAKDLKQMVKPELTGPLGARLFDKALMYKSSAIEEPIYLEFPEFKGNSRRDYWLEISHEIMHAHKFIRKYNLKEIQQLETLARAVLGIFRYRAMREAFRIIPSHYKTLLPFNLAEKLPGGDIILETLSIRLALLTARTPRHDDVDEKRHPSLSPVSLLALTRLGFMPPDVADKGGKTNFLVGDVCVGEINPLETAVKHSKGDTGRAEAAQATVDQVKVEGIDTNLAVMKELLFPLVELVRRLQLLASWEDPFKSLVFLVLVCYATYRGMMKYVLPCIFVVFAALVMWRKSSNMGKPLEAVRVTPPPSKNAIEQLLTLQEVISQVEALVQAGNIILLKLRALLFAALPQATDKVALVLILIAAVFAIVPLRYLIMMVGLEAYTREMPLRRDCSDKWLRRAREWWVRIPAAPVHLIKSEDSNKKKK
ncbi:hypothetical protein GIB67_020776 [Kingdonia uniflora]|uniref:DUF639 domain-containing protein n=1 Tax=Kingdonia uniflora TaxID=39325 RepID=A0A7J7M742_9MAGN|nr:hypothetical protein GIB67_020776 [Kingdonia uniflora]